MRWMLVVPALAVSAALVGCSKPKEEAPPPSPPSQMPMPGGPPGPSMPGGPPPVAMADPAAGKTVFATNCARCHGPGGAGKLKGTPNFTDATWLTGEKDADLLKTIHNGKGMMPAWQGRLSEKDMADALAFIRTLAQPAKK